MARYIVRMEAKTSQRVTDANTLGHQRSEWITAFDGLRALAVLAVIFNHTNGWHLQNWALGNVAVGVFYSLSGFLAYYVLRRDEIRDGAISYSFFLYRRLLRIWPAYFAVIAVVWLTSTRDQIANANQADLFTFTLNWSMGAFGQWPMAPLAHFWSIAVEEQFYLLAPLMYLALRSRHRTIFCISVFVLSNILRIAYFLSVGDHGSQNGGLYYLTYTYADTFLVGAVVAQWYENGASISRSAQVLAFVIAVLILLGVVRLWGPLVFPPYGRLAWLPYTLLPIGSGLLLVSTLPFHRQWFTRLLSTPPLQICGKLSYGLYLVHVFAMFQIGAMNSAGIGPLLAAGGATFLLTTLGYSLLLASLLYFAVEQPFLKLKSYRGAGRLAMLPPMLSVGAIAAGAGHHLFLYFFG